MSWLVFFHVLFAMVMLGTTVTVTLLLVGVARRATFCPGRALDG